VSYQLVPRAGYHVIKRKRQIEDDEKNEREQMHLKDVDDAMIRERVEKRSSRRFVKQVTVVLAGPQIDRDRNHEIQLGPRKRPDNRKPMRPKSFHDHHEGDRDHDPGMRDEKSEEANIGKRVFQVRRNDRL